MTVKFEWDNPNKLVEQVTEMLRAKGRAIARVPEAAVRNAAFELLAILKHKLPKGKTSKLTQTTGVQIDRLSDGTIQARIGTHLQYAPWVEYGTGIYGPLKRRIVARGPWPLQQPQLPLVKGKVQYRWSIAGMRPRPVFGQSTIAFLPRYVEIIERELAKETA